MKNKDALKAIKSCNPNGKVVIEIPDKDGIERMTGHGPVPVSCTYFEVDDVSLCNEITVIRIGEKIEK